MVVVEVVVEEPFIRFFYSCQMRIGHALGAGLIKMSDMTNETCLLMLW